MRMRSPFTPVALATAALLLTVSCSSTRTAANEFRWSEQDAGPVASSEGVAMAATSDGLLAWGGIDASGRLSADGWQLLGDERGAELPASPLQARHHAASAWTGSRLVVIGGSSDPNVNGVGNLRDGATYDPATKRWRTIAPIPDSLSGQIDRRCRDDTVYAASLVVIPCMSPERAGDDTTIRTVAAYRPDGDTWTTVSVFVGTDGHPQSWFNVDDRLGVVSIGARPPVSGLPQAEVTVSLAGKAAGTDGVTPTPPEPQSTIELGGVANDPEGVPVASVGAVSGRSSIATVALSRSYLARTDERGSLPGPPLVSATDAADNAPLTARVDVVALTGAPTIVIGSSLRTLGGSGLARPPGATGDGWGHWRPVDNGRRMWLVTEPSPSPDGTVGMHRLWRLDVVRSR